MRIIAKIMETFGVVCAFMGIGFMDSDLIIIPLALMATGGAIAFAGLSVEGSDYARSSR